MTRSRVIFSVGLVLACSPDEAVDSAASNADATNDAATATNPSDESGTAGEAEADTSTEADTDGGPNLDPDMGGPEEETPPTDAEGCNAIYAQDLLPTFELTVHPVVWETLQNEWLDGPMKDEEDLETKFYHPLAEFKYGDITIHNAEIRLRGNATYWYPDDKMQFQIGFHTNDPDGRFLGLKRVLFDAATFNRHMLRDRLAYAIMRDVGIKAPCANNARLVVNGEYYGIFTNVEKLDEAFLERNFDDPTGDLWKRANWTLKTNLETSNDDRIDAMRDTETVEELFSYLDIDQALRAYAAEAVIPDSDGMWAGGLNLYIYDEPIGGKFMLLPWDMDSTFERFNGGPDDDYPKEADPFVWEKGETHGRPWYDLALSDPMWFELYIDHIDEILHDGYHPDKLHERIDTWTAQIQTAVFEDVNKPYSNDTYMNKVLELHEFVDARYAFIDEWLICWQNGGVDDGDGYCEYP